MLGNRLKEIRESRGIPQRKLAEECEIGLRQLIRYEKDESDATTLQLVKLCRRLSVSADYLLGLVDTPNEPYIGTQLDEFQLRVVSLISDSSVLDILKTIIMLANKGYKNEAQRQIEISGDSGQLKDLQDLMLSDALEEIRAAPQARTSADDLIKRIVERNSKE